MKITQNKTAKVTISQSLQSTFEDLFKNINDDTFLWNKADRIVRTFSEAFGINEQFLRDNFIENPSQQEKYICDIQTARNLNALFHCQYSTFSDFEITIETEQEEFLIKKIILENMVELFYSLLEFQFSDIDSFYYDEILELLKTNQYTISFSKDELLENES